MRTLTLNVNITYILHRGSIGRICNRRKKTAYFNYKFIIVSKINYFLGFRDIR
jgi:hypothetical protein